MSLTDFVFGGDQAETRWIRLPEDLTLAAFLKAVEAEDSGIGDLIERSFLDAMVCPMCGLSESIRGGEFASLTAHILKAHPALYDRERHRNRVTDAVRGRCRSTVEDRGIARAWKSAARSRRYRWAKVAREEEAKGGDWVIRCAQRWRVSHGAARSRVERLRQFGLLPRPGGLLLGPRARCRKGLHDLNAVGARGSKGECRLCRNAAHVRRRRRTGKK